MKHLSRVLTGILLGFFFILASPLALAKPSQPAKTSEEPAPEYRLDSDERWILDRGEISEGAYVAGGILGTFPGLGIGHAVQGRYLQKGWIFTVGEIGSYGLAVAGAVNCLADSLSSRDCNGGLIVLGVAAYVGFRVWEIIDVWAGPPEHNRRYRSLKKRFPDEGSMSFYVLPLPGETLAGLQFRF